MAIRTLESVIRWAAFVGALAAALFVLGGFRMVRGNGQSDLDVDFAANLTGQLVVQPEGKLLRARGLDYGDRSSGSFTLRNITDMPLSVRVRAFSSGTQVDDVLRVAIADGRRSIFRGSLGRLRHWSAGAVRIGAGRAVPLRLVVTIPRQTRNGFRGRARDVTLEFQSQKAGGS